MSFRPDFSGIDVGYKLDANNRQVAAFGAEAVGRVDLQVMTIPISADRTTALNDSVANEFRIVQTSNNRISELNSAMQELQRISPTGVNDDKQAKVDVAGTEISQNISRQTYNTLLNTFDASGISVASLFVVTDTGGSQVAIHRLADNKTFSQVTNIMKSAVDQASQDNQLEMTTLQGLTNKFNQSIETMSDLVSKFTDLNGKLASNFRPLR